MKKSLLALAVLTSFAGAASAQSSVTIYGVVDAGITRETGAIAGSVTKLASGVQSGNRLGFKGSEDLGNGLKAIFQIENGFDIDTGMTRQGGRLFGRQAFVGLAGNAGTVALGRQYNPIFGALDSIDPFGTGLPGQTVNLMSPGNVRTDNAITYTTAPNNVGFTGTVLYGAGEVPGSNSAKRTFGFSGEFKRDALLVTLAYDKLSANTTTAPFSGGLKLLMVGATYNFGPVTAHAAYETEKGDTGNTANFRDAMVGVTIPAGPGSFMASYIHKSDRLENARRGAKQFGVGYTYSLSKRTNVYTSYARINNNKGAAWYVGDASSGGSDLQKVGESSSAFTVGIRHKF